LKALAEEKKRKGWEEGLKATVVVLSLSAEKRVRLVNKERNVKINDAEKRGKESARREGR